MLNVIIVLGVVCFLFAFMAGAAGTTLAMENVEAPETALDDDALYLFGMVAHHRDAMRMAESVVGKTDDPHILKSAMLLLDRYSRDISLIEFLARDLQYKDSRESRDRDMRRRKTTIVAVSIDPAVNFATHMIPHHAEAITMSLPILVSSRDHRVAEFAKSVIESQARELYNLRKWLDRHSSGLH